MNCLAASIKVNKDHGRCTDVKKAHCPPMNILFNLTIYIVEYPRSLVRRNGKL